MPVHVSGFHHMAFVCPFLRFAFVSLVSCLHFARALCVFYLCYALWRLEARSSFVLDMLCVCFAFACALRLLHCLLSSICCLIVLVIIVLVIICLRPLP